MNRAFEPLVRLQEGRACLALSDGNVRRDHAASAFNRLRLWVNRQPKRDEAKEFEPWFGRQMVRHALAPIDLEEKVEAHHVDEIEALLEKNARIVDALEEDFGLRLTAS